jgi:hypothetical protein
MNSSSDNTELFPLVPHSQTTDALIENPNVTEKLDLSAGFMARLSNISLSKSFIGGLIFIGIIATFFIFTKGTEICLWSDCSNTNPGHTGGQIGDISIKIVTVILLCIATLLLMLTIGIWQRGIQINLTEEVTILASMILGVIPFAIAGLGLSYLVNPKSYDSIVGLSIPIGLMTCGMPLSLAVSPFIQECIETVVAFSPFYHYGQLSFWASDSSLYDGHLLLHLIWLLWAGIAFGFITIWAYQRDSVVQ